MIARPRALALVLCLLTALSALAAGPLVPYPVEDITPGRHPHFQDLQPWSATLGEVVFLIAIGEKNGLWRTDGTSAGTHRVFDGIPGRHTADLFSPAKWNGSLYYPVSTDAGLWLFRTDGSTFGTEQIAKISGWHGGAPCGDGKLCFGSHGSGVSVTDGTAAGTRELLSTASGFEAYTVREMTSLGKRVYFNAYDDKNGLCMTVPWGVSYGDVCGELWTSDGTVAGTHVFKDILPGTLPGAPTRFFASSAGKLYFAAADPSRRTVAAAWVSDGTAEGTRVLPTVPANWAYPPFFAEFNGRVFYNAGNGELIETDGTPEGTRSVSALTGSTPTQVVLEAVAAVNGQTLLRSDYVDGGAELWSWDGARRVKLADVPEVFRPLGFLQSTGLAWFITGENALWSSDGTPEGTRHRFSILPPEETTPFPVTVTPTRLYFGDGNIRYVSDGTPEGTYRIDLDLRMANGTWMDRGKVVNGKYYFIGDDKVGCSDGTAEGTEVLFENVRLEPFAHEGHTYFLEGQTLWKTDGTRSGTLRAGEWLGVERPLPPAFIGEQAIFAEAGDTGRLLRRDPGGTLHELGLRDHDFASFTSVSGGVAFWTGLARRLTFTDGTRQGTRTVATGFQSGGAPVALGDKAIFSARTAGDTTLRLWVTDFTTGGTRPLTDFPVAPPRAELTPLLTWRNLAIFRIGANPLGEVWRSDGTAEGTYPLTAGGFDAVLADGDELVLVRFTTVAGYQVWTSDGTAAGTVLRDAYAGGTRAGDPFVMPGGGVGVLYWPNWEEIHIRNHRTKVVQVIDWSGLPSYTAGVANGNVIIFPSYRGASGRELWAVRLDGTSPAPPSSLEVEYAGIVKTATGLGASFRVSIAADGPGVPRVVVSTVDGSLQAGRDYLPFTREVIFENDHEVMLIVPFLDANAAGSLSVVLSSPVNATIIQGLATAYTGGPTRRRAVRK